MEDEALGKDEKSIQEAFEEQFNRPDYNNLHKLERHKDYNTDVSGEYVMSSSYNPYEELETEENYNEICRQIREWLKPEWAELFIAVHIDGEPIRDYAASIGESENNLTKKLERAEKKLKKIFSKRQI